MNPLLFLSLRHPYTVDEHDQHALPFGDEHRQDEEHHAPSSASGDSAHDGHHHALFPAHPAPPDAVGEWMHTMVGRDPARCKLDPILKGTRLSNFDW